MNKTILVGRLVRDIEMRQTPNGKHVGSFTLAVNRKFTNQNGEREADFINCVIWGKGAENLAKFTRKGNQIGVVGRLQVRNYENQQGQRVYVTEIIVEEFDFLESANKNNAQQPQSNSYDDFNSGGVPIDIESDDLPF